MDNNLYIYIYQKVDFQEFLAIKIMGAIRLIINNINIEYLINKINKIYTYLLYIGD